MKRFLLSSALAILAVPLSYATPSQSTPTQSSLSTASSQLPSSVKHYTLKNGLNLYVKQNRRAPVVVSMVWYKVGSADEPGGITGISHALEHMMFRGTPNYPNGQFSKTIAENGGSENAFTFTDYTVYFQKLSADKLPISFKLEADRMRHLLIKPELFAKEIKVVQEERRMRVEDNPQAVAFERFKAAAYLASPYHHPIVGWMNDLQNMQASDLQAWYKKYYAPNNATVVVVGDVDPAAVYKLAQQTFGTLPSSKLPVVKPRREPKASGLRKINVTAPAKVPYLMMGYNVPTVLTSKDKTDAYTLDMIAAILDADSSSRLQTQLVRKQHVASAVGAGYSLYQRFDTLFTLDAVPSQGHSLIDVQNALQKQIEILKTQPVTQDELDRIKTQIIAASTYKQDSLFGQAMQIGMFTTVGLPWNEDDNFIKQIESITPEKIQQVAKRYFKRDNLTVAYLRVKKV